ncbi:hypothetical protein EON77_16115 [bacterium]|nr:MAG: hypothetical protein EON77_16115 [bacterium]
MPSPHRRVGLVIDDELSSAFGALREQRGSDLPEAALARGALIDGTVFGAVLREAGSQSASREAAQEIVRNLRTLMESLALPPFVKTTVIAEIDQVRHEVGVAERRLRQRALLRSPNPHGAAALAQSAYFDAFDQQAD